MKRLALLLLSWALLAVGTILSFGAWAADAKDPRTAFQDGNELLRQARQAGKNADPAWLLRAASEYRACLAYEASTRDAGGLFEDARYNLELTKLLLTQISRSETNAGSPKSQDPSSKGQQSASSEPKSAGDPQTPANDPAAQRDPTSDSKDSPKGEQQAKGASSPKQAEGEKEDPSSKKEQQAKEKTPQSPEKAEKPNKQKKDAKQPPKQAKPNKQKPSNAQSKKGEGAASQPTPGNGQPTPEQKDEKDEKEQKEQNDKPEKRPDPAEKKEQSSQGDSDTPDKGEPGKGEAGKGEPNAPGDTEPSPGQSPPDPSGTSPSAKGEKSPKGQGRQSPPDTADQEARGGRGEKPGADGLFHPETPDPAQRQQTPPGQGPNGNSRGGGQSQDATPPEREVDPAAQAALMRLQEAIKRIQNNRSRRGPAHGREDPANLKRYRDW